METRRVVHEWNGHSRIGETRRPIYRVQIGGIVSQEESVRTGRSLRSGDRRDVELSRGGIISGRGWDRAAFLQVGFLPCEAEIRFIHLHHGGGVGDGIPVHLRLLHLRSDEIDGIRSDFKRLDRSGVGIGAARVVASREFSEVCASRFIECIQISGVDRVDLRIIDLQCRSDEIGGSPGLIDWLGPYRCTIALPNLLDGRDVLDGIDEFRIFRHSYPWSGGYVGNHASGSCLPEGGCCRSRESARGQEHSEDGERREGEECFYVSVGFHSRSD